MHICTLCTKTKRFLFAKTVTKTYLISGGGRAWYGLKILVYMCMWSQKPPETVSEIINFKIFLGKYPRAPIYVHLLLYHLIFSLFSACAYILTGRKHALINKVCLATTCTYMYGPNMHAHAWFNKKAWPSAQSCDCSGSGSGSGYQSTCRLLKEHEIRT